MYRYGIILAVFTALLSSCSKQQDVQPNPEAYNFLKARTAPGAQMPTDQRRSVENPFDRCGQLHNQGFRDMVLGTNTEGNLKQWAISLGEYTGTEGMQKYRKASALNSLSIAQAVDTARARGADELAIATWQVLAEQLQAMTSPEPADALNLINAAESALMEFDPDDRSINKERALGVSSVYRYSLALHTGQTLDGIDYGVQSWNPTPNLPPHPTSGLKLNWITLLIKDAIGFLLSFDWKEAVTASLTDLMDQLSGVGYSVGEAFHPNIESTEPFLPGVGSVVLPDN